MKMQCNVAANGKPEWQCCQLGLDAKSLKRPLDVLISSGGYSQQWPTISAGKAEESQRRTLEGLKERRM
jgi:hypothetical protein